MEYSEVSGMKPTEEQRELYASMGWEFVTPLADDLFIYSTADAAAPPLHNDYSGLEKPMKHMRQKELALAWLFLIFSMLTNIGPVAGYIQGQGLDYWRLIEFGTLRAIAALLISILTLVIAVIHFRRASLAKRIIIKGELPPAGKHYRRRAVVAGLLLPLSLALALGWIALKLDNPYVHHLPPITAEDSFAFPLIGELFPDEGALLDAAIKAGEPEYRNSHYRERDLLAPEYVTAEQSVYDVVPGQEWDGIDWVFTYSVYYYETVSETVAARLTEDLVDDRGPEYTRTELSCHGADTVVFYEAAGEPEWTRMLVLRVGDKVANIRYLGGHDIREALPIFVEYLSGARQA